MLVENAKTINKTPIKINKGISFVILNSEEESNKVITDQFVEPIGAIVA